MMRDAELIETLESVYNIAKARSDEGGPFGFGEADLESYHLVIEAYDRAFGLSQMGTLKRKVAVKTLPQLFNEADGILEVIDKYVAGMRNTNPDFVNYYNDSRVIKISG
ncbi:MAG: hypothetical protein IPL53_17190 [Ignavibacteria bacterium]|nr:hypothetical protein [Ignavibacteria bacterium]